MSADIFRPFVEPAATLYDALMDEASHRKERKLEDWILKERARMWATARDCALKLGRRVPTMAEVEKEERNAQGHCDYVAKWAIGIHLILTAIEQKPA